MSDRVNSGEQCFDELRAGVVERLRSRQPEIEHAVFERIKADVPDSTGDTNPEYQTGLQDTIKAAINFSLQAIEQGNAAADVPQAAAQQARRAARAGVSLGTVQRRYFAGHGALGDFMAWAVDGAGLSSNGEMLHHLRRTQETVLAHITAAIEREYTHESELISKPSEQRRVTVQSLLAGEIVDQAHVDELDYQLHACWHLGLILSGPGADDLLTRLRTGLDHKPLTVPASDGTTWVWFGGQRELAVTEVERVLSNNGNGDARLVIGEPRRGLDGWRQTHREARAALVIARHNHCNIARYADSPLFAAAVRDETLMTWLRGFLAPVRNHKGSSALLQTLRALIDAECNRRAAAAVLEVNRHTVESRLRTAEALLGRPLPTCLPELDIALRLENLEPIRQQATPDNG